MDTSVLVIGVFTMIWAIGLIVGTAYLRGGTHTVRRLAPQLAIFVPVFLLVVIAESVIFQNNGGMALGLMLLPVVAVGLVVQGLRRRRLRMAAPVDANISTGSTPATRRFVVIWVIVLLAGSTVVSFLASKAGL
jgi:hypothetical protein